MANMIGNLMLNIIERYWDWNVHCEYSDFCTNKTDSYLNIWICCKHWEKQCIDPAINKGVSMMLVNNFIYCISFAIHEPTLKYLLKITLHSGLRVKTIFMGLAVHSHPEICSTKPYLLTGKFVQIVNWARHSYGKYFILVRTNLIQWAAPHYVLWAHLSNGRGQ